MIRDPSDGSVKDKHEGPICKDCGCEFYYDYQPSPNDGSGYCENCFKRPLSAKRPTSADNWGLKSLDRAARKPAPAPTAEELRAHYAKHDLGFQKKEKGE